MPLPSRGSLPPLDDLYSSTPSTKADNNDLELSSLQRPSRNMDALEEEVDFDDLEEGEEIENFSDIEDEEEYIPEGLKDYEDSMNTEEGTTQEYSYDEEESYEYEEDEYAVEEYEEESYEEEDVPSYAKTSPLDKIKSGIKKNNKSSSNKNQKSRDKKPKVNGLVLKVGIGVIILLVVLFGASKLSSKLGLSEKKSEKAGASIMIIETHPNYVVASVMTTSDGSGIAQALYQAPNGKIILCESSQDDFSTNIEKELDLGCYNSDGYSVSELTFISSSVALD